MSLDLVRWDAPGPYDVVFSTRRGGVSEGPFASLNLGRKLGDVPERVDENRRRLCAEVGADLDRLALNYQRHTAQVNRAEAGRRGATGDGLWTDEPELPILALGADCALIALARTNGERPAVGVLHAGRIGLLAGIAEAGAAVLDGRVAAVVGPTIGPCCYEVGEDIAAAFRARFGADVVSGRKLDLWTSAERALREAGCASVERLDLCSACDPDRFFSYRRDGKPRGGHGVLARVA
ncbi:MAG: laccase domain-containing protein [Actinobacteria bacterium]|nr:MAG: laccase domain-containing protein [Actinomycetota bacterium]